MRVFLLSKGFSTTLIGPTLPDLETQTNTETDQMSYVLTAKSFTNFAGAFLGKELIQESQMAFCIVVCLLNLFLGTTETRRKRCSFMVRKQNCDISIWYCYLDAIRARLCNLVQPLCTAQLCFVNSCAKIGQKSTGFVSDYSL